MVLCVGLMLAAPGPFLKNVMAGIICGGMIFASILMNMYTAHYFTTQWRFRNAREESYVFGISRETHCGKSRCVELLWDQDWKPLIHTDAAAGATITQGANAKRTSQGLSSQILEQGSGYCIRLPVQFTADQARLPVRKWHNFTRTDFFKCPAAFEIVHNWPPRSE